MRRIYISALVAIMMLFGALQIFAGTSELMFDAGSEAYLSGDYQEALDNWLQIEKSGYQSGALFYNIGNAYYKLGNTGKTILYWERAQELLGDDEDLKANLEIVRSQLQDKLHERVQLPIWDILNNIRAHFPVKVVAIVAILLSFLLFGMLSASRWLIRQLNVKLFLSKASWGVGVLLMFHLFIIGLEAYEDSAVRNGVVLNQQVQVLSAPTEGTGKMLFTIHEGAKVSIVRALKDWYEISIGKDRQGWVPKSSMSKI